MPEQPPTDRTRVRQAAARGTYSRETILSILDEGLVAHVGFVVDGSPVVIPMSYGRDGDWLVLHGSRGSRFAQTLSGGIDVCVTVTLLDGVVVARSAMHHSMNYRSVVVYGRATAVNERDVKIASLRALVEHIIPGYWDKARQPDENELTATTVLRIPLNEASAKIRTGPPKGDREDDPAVWTGELPLRLVAQPPIPHPDSPAHASPPSWSASASARR